MFITLNTYVRKKLSLKSNDLNFYFKKLEKEKQSKFKVGRKREE